MPNEPKTTISFSLPVKSADWIKKLAKIEEKTEDQLFEDMLELYSMETIERIIHEFRGVEKAGTNYGDISVEEIEKIICEIGNEPK